MTTIAYWNRTLVTDSRRVFNDESNIYITDIDEPKGYKILDDEQNIVGVLAICGTQPSLETAFRFCQLFKCGINIANKILNSLEDEELRTFIANYLLDQAMIMYKDAAYEVVAVESLIGKIPELVFREIKTLYVNGSGLKIVKTLILSGYPLAQIMKEVSKLDSMTSPDTYVFMQDSLKEIKK